MISGDKLNEIYKQMSDECNACYLEYLQQQKDSVKSDCNFSIKRIVDDIDNIKHNVDDS